MVGGLVLVASIALVFIVENSHQVHVSFVFFSSDISLIWVIILSVGRGRGGRGAWRPHDPEAPRQVAGRPAPPPRALIRAPTGT